MSRYPWWDFLSILLVETETVFRMRPKRSTILDIQLSISVKIHVETKIWPSRCFHGMFEFRLRSQSRSQQCQALHSCFLLWNLLNVLNLFRYFLFEKNPQWIGGSILIVSNNSNLIFLQLRKLPRKNYRERAWKALIGRSVVTFYNNWTYLIEGIVWRQSPKDHFWVSWVSTLSHLLFIFRIIKPFLMKTFRFQNYFLLLFSLVYLIVFIQTLQLSDFLFPFYFMHYFQSEV